MCDCQTTLTLDVTLEITKAVITTMIRLIFDCNSTALRPFCDWDAALCGLNKINRSA